ncbi:MAG: DUF2231 domain-containing protein [Acidobacteriota bacterium]|nr:DUF2231 domain-containing protein [Acidobacteriota bacterium]
MAADVVSRDAVAAMAEQQHWISSDAEKKAQSSIQDVFRRGGAAGQGALSFLHGDFLHEPLHAVLTDIPVGAWTVTVVFDLLAAATRRRSLDRVADGALKLGLVGAVLAAVAGAADWSEIEHRAPRRIGAVHALLNIAATGAFAVSWIYRRKRRTRSDARLLALGAYAVTSVSAHLGGNLVYEHRVGVRTRPFGSTSARSDED